MHRIFQEHNSIMYTEGEDCPLFCSEFCQDSLPISRHQPQHGSWCVSHRQEDHLGPSASVAVMLPTGPLGASVRATSARFLRSPLVRFHLEIILL